MTSPSRPADEAAHWALRLEADASGDARLTPQAWGALTAWLEADPAHRRALDEAEALMAAAWTAPAPARRPLLRSLQRGAPWGALAAAAALAAVMILKPVPPPAPRVYAAGASPRSLALPDGSVVVLDRSSRLAVAFTSRAREVTLSSGGHALFDVRHAPDRPFIVRVDAAAVQVLGTRFDVDDASAGLRVAVARGEVGVSLDAVPGRAWRIAAGRRFIQTQGSSAVQATSVQAVGAWTRGELVYEAAPWSEVARDLTRCWGRPVRVDAALARGRFSGVLQLGSAAQMSRELELFAPVSVRSGATETVLKARATPP